MTYARFALMIVVSTAVMFVLMYLNTYEMAHVAWSQTRGWMALLMAGAMMVIMMGLMWGMYPRKGVNAAIVAAGLLLGAVSVWAVRSQQFVDDGAWMRAMIPHHSIAVLTSSEAHIRDPRVRRLADGIIEAQMQEIAEMRALLADLRDNPLPADAPDLAPLDAEAVPVADAVADALVPPGEAPAGAPAATPEATPEGTPDATTEATSGGDPAE